MGTRGAFGVKIDGVVKVTYNQFDSYPEGKGLDFVKDLMNKSRVYKGFSFKRAARNWVDVTDTVPTKEQIKYCESFSNFSVSRQSDTDWYCLLRELQGNILEHLHKCKWYENAAKFMNDTLFCEWAYIWNLDDNTFEVYDSGELVHKFKVNKNLLNSYKRAFKC